LEEELWSYSEPHNYSRSINPFVINQNNVYWCSFSKSGDSGDTFAFSIKNFDMKNEVLSVEA